MPYPGEHACRLVNPGDCQDGSFRRANNERTHEGKSYHVVYAKRKSDGVQVDQSYRYPTDDWSEAEARSHCKDHDGLRFEPAADEEGSVRSTEGVSVAGLLRGSWAITNEGMASVRAKAEYAYRGLLTQEGKRPQGSTLTSVRGDVAVIEVIGPMFHYNNILTMIFGLPATETVAQEYRAALDNPEINKVVLWIDSPGGQLGGVSELSQLISKGKQKKRTVAYVGDIGASAAYWIASAASEVVATDTALIGSIGAIMGIMVRDDDEDSIEIVSSQSPRKRPDPRTDEGLRQLQERIDALSEVFIGAVMQYRGMTRDAVISLQGDVAIAERAINLGLADRIGSLEGLIEELSTQNTTGEANMDITAENVKTNYPQVAEEIAGKSREEGKQEGKQEGSQEGQDHTLGLVEALLGTEAKDKVKQAADSGLTAEQLKQAQGLLGTPSGGSGGGKSSRDQVLEGLESAHGHGVRADASGTGASSLEDEAKARGGGQD